MRSTHVLFQHVAAFVSIVFLSVTSCGDGSSSDPDVVMTPPAVQFRFETRGQLVAFQVTRPTNPASQDTVRWNFGDGQTAVGQNPVHFFAQAGSYSVTAEFTGAGGTGTSRQTIGIEVLNSCDANAVWKSLLPTEFGSLTHMAAGDPGFVGLNREGNVFFSENGINWCDVPAVLNSGYADLEWANDQYWILANKTTPPFTPKQSLLFSSLNGKQWSSEPGPPIVPHRFSVQGSRRLVIGGELPYNITPGSSLYVQEADNSWREVFNPNIPLWDIFWTGTSYMLFGRTNEDLAPGTADTLWTSSNGLDWSQQSLDGLAWDQIATNGSRYVRARSVIETSADGITWTQAQVALSEEILALAWGNDHFLAIGSQYAYRSEDGNTWTLHELPNLISSDLANLSWNGWVWVISDSQNLKTWSSDGITWQTFPTEEFSRQPYFWLTAVADGTSFKVGAARFADGVRQQGFLLETNDGTDRSMSRISEDLEILSLKNTEYGLMACGDTGTSLQPSGGVFLETTSGWQQVFSGNSPLLHLAAKERMVVATALNGQVLLSQDSQAWQVVTSFNNIQILDRYDGYFVILTTDGNLHRSQDGLAWETIRVPLQSFVPGDIAYHNGVWILLVSDAQNNGVTWMRSEDMRDWSFFDLPFSTEFVSVSANEQGFYALGRHLPKRSNPVAPEYLPYAPVVWSGDGQNWQPEAVPGMQSPGSVTVGSQGAIVVANKKIFIRGRR